MKIAICDDDILELKKIHTAVLEFKSNEQPRWELNVEAFSSARALLIEVQKSGGFDLYILDIVMSELSGIELAAKIRAHNGSGKIIFLTSSPEFAVDSYKVDAFYYLLKSSSKEELYSVLKKALDAISQEGSTSIIIKEKKKWTRVMLQAIQYVESINHTVFFHLFRRETASCFSTLNRFEDVLLADRRFVKCHKSYIVNMNFITSITNKDFILEGNITVPISRNLFQQVKEIYFDYVFKGNE